MNYETTDIALIYFVRIGGIPWLFATAPFPDSWEYGSRTVQLEGEEYSWKPTIVNKSLEIGESKIQPWLGVASPASFKLEVAIDSDTKGLLNKNLYSATRNVCQLTGNCLVGGISFGVDSTSGFATSGYLYAQNETVYYDSKTDYSFKDVVRARFGSHTGSHFGKLHEPDSYSSGLYITDFPLSMSGRTITVYASEAILSDGIFVPVESGPDNCTVVYSGIIQSAKYTQNLQAIEFMSTDLTSLLDKQVGGTILEAMLPNDDRRVIVDDFSDRFAFAFQSDGKSYYFEAPLTQGYRTFDEINSDLATYIAGVAGLSGYLNITLGKSDESKYTVKFTAIDDLGTFPYANYSLLLGHNQETLTAELGFTEAKTVECSDYSTFYVWEFEADEPLPVFRYPNSRKLRNILVKPLANNWGWNFSDPFQMSDDDSNLLPNFVRVGDEIFKFYDYDIVTSEGETYNRLLVNQRGCFGTMPEDKETLITIEDEAVRVSRGIAIDACEWPRLVAYLLVAGNGSDLGFDEAAYNNFAGSIPRALIDEDSFASLCKSFAGKEKHQVYVDTPTSIKEIVQPILVLHQAYICVDNGKLTLKEIPQALATDVNDELDLDTVFSEDDILSINNLGVDLSEDNIVNVVTGTDVGFNWATQKGKRSITVADGLSCGTFGRKDSVEISMRSVKYPVNYTRMVDVASPLLASWGSPFTLLNLTINSNRALSLSLGDAVRVSHTILQAFLEASSALSGRVFGIRKTLKGDGARTNLLLVLPAQDGRRISMWAPCAKVSSISSKPLTVTIFNDYYSGLTEFTDTEFFPVDAVCRAFNVGEEETTCTFKILSRTNNGTTTTLEIQNLDGDVADLDPYVAVLEYVDFDYNYGGVSPTENQLNYTYIADDSSPYLTDASSNDYPPFHYA